MTTDLTPGSPEWYRVITASKVSAILGVAIPRDLPADRELDHLWDMGAEAVWEGDCTFCGASLTASACEDSHGFHCIDCRDAGRCPACNGAAA